MKTSLATQAVGHKGSDLRCNVTQGTAILTVADFGFSPRDVPEKEARNTSDLSEERGLPRGSHLIRKYRPLPTPIAL